MNIGIVSSGNDTLALWRILTKYSHTYLVYHDQTHFPFGTKDPTFMLIEIEKAVSFLREQGAEKIILDPVYELAMPAYIKARYKIEEGTLGDIFPLFTTYLQDYAFKYSLVGKIGILTDFWSTSYVQALVKNVEQGAMYVWEPYQPTENQKNTKKFSLPFSYWVKSANARPSGIADLGVHNPYLIRTLKNDLRYFKDANVDTLVPMHYHYFRMQRTMKAFFNFGKTRFHDLSVIEECFKNLMKDEEESPYSVHIRTNQDEKFLFKEKELIWLLQRGKEVELKVERI